MRLLRAAVGTLVGLFVADWTQTAGILVILAGGYLVARSLHSAGIGFAIAAALGAHLVYTTMSEGRRRMS